MGPGVGVGVAVGVGVFVAVLVGVFVAVLVGVNVEVAVGVGVFVAVFVGVNVEVPVVGREDTGEIGERGVTGDSDSWSLRPAGSGGVSKKGGQRLQQPGASLRAAAKPRQGRGCLSTLSRPP